MYFAGVFSSQTATTIDSKPSRMSRAIFDPSFSNRLTYFSAATMESRKAGLAEQGEIETLRARGVMPVVEERSAQAQPGWEAVHRQKVATKVNRVFAMELPAEASCQST